MDKDGFDLGLVQGFRDGLGDDDLGPRCPSTQGFWLHTSDGHNSPHTDPLGRGLNRRRRRHRYQRSPPRQRRRQNPAQPNQPGQHAHDQEGLDHLTAICQPGRGLSEGTQAIRAVRTHEEECDAAEAGDAEAGINKGGASAIHGRQASSDARAAPASGLPALQRTLPVRRRRTDRADG